MGVWAKILEFAGIIFVNWKVTSKQTVPDCPIIHFLPVPLFAQGGWFCFFKLTFSLSFPFTCYDHGQNKFHFPEDFDLNFKPDMINCGSGNEL